MKLNLGCGETYKKDYLNVDAFDSTVADKIMSATDLQLEENTADEIYASQVIEHLGITGSIYMLSECFRVLKPQKKLVIETPDLQKSFEKYVNGDREVRKNILPWIYGVDIPGMVHRFCYPEDLLEETLQKLGFVNIEKECFEIDPYEPNLKVTCKKPEIYQSFQVIARFRKKLLQQHIVDVGNQLIALEQEQLIEFFTKKLIDFLQTTNQSIIKEITINGSIQSPTMVRLFLDELKVQKAISEEGIEEYIEILTLLTEIDFPSLLLRVLKQTPGFVGEQHKLFTITSGLGMKIIEKLMHSEKKRELVTNLQKATDGIAYEGKIIFFSPKLVMLKANHLFSMGIKAFTVSDYEKARPLFMDSLELHRDQILTYWNLARLSQTDGKTDEAVVHYKNALQLLDMLDYGDNKEKIGRILEHEMNNPSHEIFSKPIASLNEK